MPTAKQQVLEAVKKLPNKATWDDIMYEIYARKKIDAGIHAADEGRTVRQNLRKTFYALTDEIRRSMKKRRICEKALLEDFERSQRSRSRRRRSLPLE